VSEARASRRGAVDPGDADTVECRTERPSVEAQRVLFVFE
jgi:hypothetical protein